MLQIARQRDVKAPRFRPTKYRHTVLNRDLFKLYSKTYPEGIKEYLLFKAIIEDYHTLTCDSVVENRDGVKLPANMGILALCSFKPKLRQPLHWLNTDKTNLKIKDLNIQTDGLVCKIIYSVYNCNFRYRDSHIWKFDAYRGFKNKVSAAFREHHNIYKRLDNKHRSSKIFKDDYIRTNFLPKRHEQGVVDGQPDNG